VIYATSGWCIHDTRWFTALKDSGLDPIAMSVTGSPEVLPVGVRAFGSAEDLRSGIDGLIESEPIPILAGPLTTITRSLVGAKTRIVGLSWGWDLQPEAIAEVFDPALLALVSDLDALIVDSTVTRDVALDLGLSEDRIVLIPWGIDVDLFNPEGPIADLSRFGASADDIVILSLRSHTSIHRVGDIIEAFAVAVAEQPRLFLLVGGEGPLTEQHQVRVRELAIANRVRFIRMLPEEDLPPLFRAASVYVTATAVDGTSVTLLQALACGTPVLASAIPGNVMWMELAGNDALFAVGDLGALAQSMTTVDKVRNYGELGLASASIRTLADWRLNTNVLGGLMAPTSSPGD
jgi:glycosyltransferase involved in cell wall biosynthesis